MKTVQRCFKFELRLAVELQIYRRSLRQINPVETTPTQLYASVSSSRAGDKLCYSALGLKIRVPGLFSQFGPSD